MTITPETCPERAYHGNPFRYCGVKGCGWTEATVPEPAGGDAVLRPAKTSVIIEISGLQQGDATELGWDEGVTADKILAEMKERGQMTQVMEEYDLTFGLEIKIECYQPDGTRTAATWTE